jgi:Arc/MetJ family transcription regulator
VIKRKSHNLDEALLKRAKRVLGVATETEAIHEALQAVLIGERIVDDLRAASAAGTFRRNFSVAMKREARSR